MDSSALILFALIVLIAVAALVAVGIVAFLVADGIGWLVGRASRGTVRSVRNARFARYATYIAFALVLAIEIYVAIYPPDSFYLGEFEVATHRRPPDDAIVIAKEASYPDFHGDYCSFARFRLTPASFAELLPELIADARLRGSDGMGVTSGGTSTLSLPPMAVMRSFSRTDLKSDHHHSVSFLGDGAHIDVQICVT